MFKVDVVFYTLSAILVKVSVSCIYRFFKFIVVKCRVEVASAEEELVVHCLEIQGQRF